MVQPVIPSAEQAALAEIDLDVVERAWQRVPTVARDWHTWSEDAQFDYQTEWQIVEDRMALLDDWAVKGKLTDTHMHRLEAVKVLAAQYGPTLDGIIHR